MLSALKNGLQSWLGKRREPQRPTPDVPDPRSPAAESADALYAQGLEHRRLGRREDALAAFERAVEIRSDHAPALVQQGELCHELGHREAASDAFTLALAHDPMAAGAWIGYGRLLRDCELAVEAVTHLRRAVELAPASAAAWLELGLSLNQAGRTDEAIAAYERAIAVAPADPAAYVNLGLIQLAQRGDAARAEILFREAAARAPGMLEPAINIGLALHEQGRSREALAHFDAMLKADPACVEARWHRAGVRLAREDYARGWDDYEARKARGEGNQWRVPPPLPEWDGKPIVSGTLLVYAEQGVGDEIMFASCLPETVAVAPRCVVECEPRLAALFARSFPRAMVCGVKREDHSAWLGELRGAAVQCAIGSLPRFFRRSSASFEGRGAYLHADPQRVEHWHAALDEGGGALRVGIAWRGGTLKTRRELRSTALADWMPVLSTRGARFFALHADAEDEIAAVDANGVPITPLPAGTDLDELAALISALDLVITVQGTTAHLAGALGRPVWILLNHSAEWRYLAAGARMPWYPSATLVRQPAAGDWPAVFGEAAAMLARRVAEGTRAP